jgi:hypothetical protein
LGVGQVLKTGGADREEVRKNKNKNKALERLKEKIRLEKAARTASSKEAPLDGGPAPPATKAPKPKKREEDEVSDDSDDDDDDEEEEEDSDDEGPLLLVKRKREDVEDEAVEPSLLEKPKKHKVKKLRIQVDAPTGEGKRIVFGDDDDDDGGEGAAARREQEGASDDLDTVRALNEEYVKRVQQRLQAARGG